MIKTNWIKMRSSLLTHPRVISMVNHLSNDDGFLHFMCDEFAIKACAESLNTNVRVTDLVTRVSLRYVTVAGLLALWSAARMFSDGGVLDGICISDLDEMAGVPGIGNALQNVGWVTFDVERKRVILKDFTSWNDQEFKGEAKSNAERQREWRKRQKMGSQLPVTESNDSNGREEKSREEKRGGEECPQRPNSPFEKPPVKDVFVNPIARFDEDVQKEAREAHAEWHFWSKGTLPNLHNESVHKDLNRFAAAAEAQPRTIVKRVKDFIAKPSPGWNRDAPVWKLLKQIGCEAEVNAQPPKTEFKLPSSFEVLRQQEAMRRGPPITQEQKAKIIAATRKKMAESAAP